MTRPALLEAHELILDLLQDAGVEELDSHRLPKTAPFITGEIPAPPGAPTVLLYGHYDVVPAGDESKWESPPFEPTVRDGAMFGRGSADSKSNVIAHVGALRAWDGRPPVGIKLVIEGQEEVGSALNDYPADASRAVPLRRDADRATWAASGRALPTLTSRCAARRCRRSRSRRSSARSTRGQYGGAAPDALIVLLHALASLHDEHGDVAVEGLRREEWTGAGYSEDEFRELAEIAARAAADRQRRPRLEGVVRARRSPSPASTCRPSTTR